MNYRSDHFVFDVFRCFIAIVCVIVMSVGCNQQRYKPAKRRAAVKRSTLPVGEPLTPGFVRWNSLPGRSIGSLPRRAGGSTLPYRGGSTLPYRGGSTLPYRGGSTLPYRGGFSGTMPLRNWSTLPGRGVVGGVNTLPRRQIYPESRFQLKNWSTLPRRGELNTLPRR